MLILPGFVVENNGWFATKPPRQDVTHRGGERVAEHGGPADASTYDKP